MPKKILGQRVDNQAKRITELEKSVLEQTKTLSIITDTVNNLCIQIKELKSTKLSGKEYVDKVKKAAEKKRVYKKKEA